MKAEELKGKTQDELKKLVMDMRATQMTTRFELAGGQLADTSKVRKTRRDIARAKTAMSALANGAAETAPKAKKAKATTKTEKAPAKKAAAKAKK